MATVVLCIDDRPELLELRKAVLESSGYHVETVTSGYAAIKMLQAAPVDAVLLEYKQQGVDAEAIACQIRQRFPNVPIILLSAYSDMPERILWLVDAYLLKSELPEALVPIIDRVTRPPNARESTVNAEELVAGEAAQMRPIVCRGCEEQLSEASNAIRHHSTLMHAAIRLAEGSMSEEQHKDLRDRVVASFDEAELAWFAYRQHLVDHGLLPGVLRPEEQLT